MSLLSLYLESLEQDASDLRKLTFGKPLVVFSKQKDRVTGLLRFEKDQITKNLRFLFVFPNETEIVFHTVGMKFNIDIYFFDKDGSLVSKRLNCSPGIEDIRSKGPCKYVVECLSDEEEED
jgi:uncharacterized membrane protein (UPF0127 family)